MDINKNNNSKKIKLSIVVPTKNRYAYLKDCIQTLSNILSDEIEIIIQDNSDENYEILKFLEENNFPNVNYFYNKNYLSVSQNCSIGVDNTNGQYVCMIGDDDTVSTNIIEVVEWMESNEIDSCVLNLARFYWPDIVFKRINYSSLSLNKWPQKPRKLNPKAQLIRSLKLGGTSLLKMPKVYHGIVKKSVLNKVKSTYGTYFPGPSPDMANATALSLVVSKHYYLSVPVIISGYSFKSTGGMGARGNHLAELKDITHISKEQIDNWEEKNPKYWLPQTVWAESMLKSLKQSKSNLYTSFKLEASLYSHIFEQ